MMNDLEILNIMSKTLGRATIKSKFPQIGKIAYYTNNKNQITELFFEGCNLLDETIPTELWELSHLEKLYLNDNQLLNFPLGLTRLKNLKILNLKNNQFQVISSKIEEMSSLEELDLCDNKLQTFSKELGKLPHLKKLRLNDNLLTSLPKLEKECIFKSLISLDLDYAKVKELPQWVFEISSLRFLSLTGLRLNRFPTQVRFLKKLERLYLDSTKFQNWSYNFDLPESLKLLVLDGAQINKIPDCIIQKKPLYIRNQMDISENYSGLQVSIGNLFPELDETLILSSNPEISYKYLMKLYSSTKSITKQTNSRLTDLKVVLLGTGGTGKSSLVQRLCLNDPDDDNIPLDSLETTHGVNIDYHIVLKDIKDDKTSGLYNYTLHFWDFGGQTKYMGLNKLLLTDKAIYIIVLDARTEGTLDWWLSIVQTYAPNSPVLLVLNKIDENPQANFNFEYYYNKYYPHIYNCCFKISCLYPSQSINKISSIIAALKNVIEKNMDILSPVWNYNWNKVREKLQQLYLVEKKAIISSKDYKKVCNRCGILDEEEQKLLLEILHTSGDCIKFSNGRKNILNPTWIVDYLYILYNQMNKKTPILDYDTYVQIMEKNDCYDDYIDDILQILEERGLCVTITYSSTSEPQKRKKIFCPTFLPERTDYYQKRKDKQPALKYIFEGKVPLDFEFQQLVSKEFAQSYQNNWNAWQYGLSFYLEEFDSEILIELVNNKLILTIYTEHNYNCSKTFLKIRSDILNNSAKGFLSQKIIYTQKNGTNTILPFKVMCNLYFKGIEEYFFPQEDQSGNLVQIDIKALGKKCGLSEEEFGKEMDEESRNMQQMSKEVKEVQVIINQGDFIQKGGKKESYGDYKVENTIAMPSKDSADKNQEELKSYITDIKNSIPDISKEDIDAIDATLNTICSELEKENPQKNLLKTTIRSLDSFLSIANGTVDFGTNISKLIEFIQQYL